MIRALIIEDEIHGAERLKSLLEKGHGDLVTVVGMEGSVTGGLQAIHSKNPDVVFLDVELGNENAFQILTRLDRIDFQIIFTTAHEKFALNAIKFSALDYLLKPIDRDELAIAIQKFQVRGKESFFENKIENLIHHLKDTRVKKKICIPSLGGVEFIPILDIIRCQADVNYTHLFLRDGRKITISRTLKEFERLLSDFQFFRIHNSHLVNLHEVRSYQKGKGGYLILNDGSELEVAIRRKDSLLEAMKGI